MKSDVKKSYFSILICCVLSAGVSVGYVAYRSHEAQEEHVKKMEEDKERIKSYRTKDSQSYSFDVSNWTFDLKDMPASPERTDFSNSVVKATQDNVITDEEYLELESEYKALERINEINVLKADLGGLVAADVPDKETTPAEGAK